MSETNERIGRKDLLQAVVARTGVSRGDALKCLDATFELIASALEQDMAVSIKGFGTFDMRDTPAKTKKNPSTGLAVQVPAGRKVRLRMTAAKA